MKRNSVILVNEEDQAIGSMDKLEAHQKGMLHRAFSIFLFNSKGEMLLQQRAAHKYHGAGLWTNACCSHPEWGEDIQESAMERLFFEMGLQCELHKSFSFLYYTPVENGLIEHEYDHVFVGYTDLNPKPNPQEVAEYQWVSDDLLQTQIQLQPERFTYWFKLAMKQL